MEREIQTQPPQIEQERSEPTGGSAVKFIEKVAESMFPGENDKQDLVKKKLLGTIDGDGEAQLAELIAGRETKGNIEMVKIYEAKKISVGQDEKDKIIMTNSLNGCRATVLACESADGSRMVGLTHFPDFMKDRQKAGVEGLVDEVMRAAKEKKAVIFAQKKRPEGIEDLKKVIQDSLGSDADVQVELYDSDTTEEGSGVVVVQVPPKEKGPVSFLTWYKNGTLLEKGE